MKSKILFILFFIFLMFSLSSRISFSQEDPMNTICRRGVAIYPNGTGCTDMVYLTEEKVEEEVQIYSMIITVLVILCLVGIFGFLYKKFLRKKTIRFP